MLTQLLPSVKEKEIQNKLTLEQFWMEVGPIENHINFVISHKIRAKIPAILSN